MKNVILKTVLKFLTPFFIIFASYIQFHGELAPGGAFQAGAILATFVIIYHIVFSVELISLGDLLCLSALGVGIYATAGFISIIFNLSFLNYDYLASSKQLAQKIGIFIIELGIVCTVFSVLTGVYYSIETYDEKLLSKTVKRYFNYKTPKNKK